MASTEFTQASDATNPSIAPPSTAVSPTQGPNGAAGPSGAEHGAVNAVPTPTHNHQPTYLSEVLTDAERLMQYAAETGIDVDENLRKSIMTARAATPGTWTGDTAANLLAAFTKLTARVKPVTAHSLKVCAKEDRKTVRTYWIVGLCLTIVVVPFSLVSFITSGIADGIRKDIATANELAVTLTAQLGGEPDYGQVAAPQSAHPPAPSKDEVIAKLQQFASTIRTIDIRARQLNFFVLYFEKDPFESARKEATTVHDAFELPTPLSDLAKAKDGRILVYQKVRYFAQNILDDVSVFYNAITTCILPILYAVLGTCAYLLRSYEQQISARTYTHSAANSARFMIAVIGGTVVGLFNNFSITQGVSISPLAIAFLVGYAVDVFFSFLEGLTQAFAKSRGSVGAASPPPST